MRTRTRRIDLKDLALFPLLLGRLLQLQEVVTPRKALRLAL